MDPSERLAFLRQELFNLQEKLEKTKFQIQKTLKEIVLDKNTSKVVASSVKQANEDISKSKVLFFTLGIREMKLPEKQKYKYKSDYETFKLTSTIMITVLTLLNLLISQSKIIDTLQILMQMYIYSTLTIREHILINNGSHIKKWWILHHYICIVSTGMMLTCPEESFSLIRIPILKFLFLLSCSQIVQYQYQMRRLYILRALEKADPLETISEVMNVSFIANLWMAVCILVFFQFIQIYVAYYIYTLHMAHRWTHYQPLIGAISICIMAFGNMFTIFYTYYNKHIICK